MVVPGQPGQTVPRDHIFKITRAKWTGSMYGSSNRVAALQAKSPKYHKKKEKEGKKLNQNDICY
jgi:hypothetical protein